MDSVVHLSNNPGLLDDLSLHLVIILQKNVGSTNTWKRELSFARLSILSSKKLKIVTRALLETTERGSFLSMLRYFAISLNELELADPDSCCCSVSPS